MNRKRAASRGVACAIFLGCTLLGCAGWRGAPATVESIRVSEVADVGDSARRASQRLVLRGLEEEEAGRRERAAGHYERALQVDPTNPYAFLALARYRVDGPDPGSALVFLDQAETLFEAQGERSPRVDVVLTGLRGQAYYESGEVAVGVDLLEQARTVSPDTWGDGRLGASELK